MDLDNVEANTKDIEINYKNLDSENQTIQRQLEEQKSKQEILEIKDSDELVSSQKEIDELNTKEKEIQDAIIDGINCINGR
jgi:predicted  nucleic acid-binding Zn-ribbon protein